MYSVKLWICLPETNTVSSRINLMIRCLKVTQRLKYSDNSPTSPSYVCHKPPYIQEEGLVIIHRWIWITRALPVLLVPSMHSGSDAHHPLRVRRQQAAGFAHYTPAVPPTTHQQFRPLHTCSSAHHTPAAPPSTSVLLVHYSQDVSPVLKTFHL